MEEKKVFCSFITPLFSYGVYKNTPEFRTAQVKGIMRYVYRITCPSQTQMLQQNEGILFGEASNGSGHASPVRLVIEGEKDQVVRGSMRLLLHKEKKGRNPSMEYLNKGMFQLSIKVRPISKIKSMSEVEEKDEVLQRPDINWYRDLAILSLTLCGLGRRSRKGRGAVAVEDMKTFDLEQAKKWILDALNRTAGMFSGKGDKTLYTFAGGIIKPSFKTAEIRRPVIQKIWFGSRLDKCQVENFLRAIDELCHDKHDKIEKVWTDKAKATGYVDKKKRLASPLWISLIQVKDGVYPVYMCVKAIAEKRELDAGCEDREAFVTSLEKKMERR